MGKGERTMDKGHTISISRRILLLIRRTKLLIVLRRIDIVMKTTDYGQRTMVNGQRSHPDGSLLSVNPTWWSFPPYSLTLIKLRKSHLGNSSKLKRVFFLVAQQRLSKLVFVLAPTSVDCPRFGVGCL